jgi:ClpP class serine protease
MTEIAKRQPRYVKPGEMLAMDPKCLHSGPEAMFWLMDGGVTPNERIGNVAIVHIRGELEHHKSYCGESYEGILERYKAATTGEDVVQPPAKEGQVVTPVEPPTAIILCIDSPGGVVSGLNETVKSIQRIRKESGIKTIAYVNEMAASAAYALACSCEEILCPPSAIIGSIGVISTMISQAAKNKKDGYDVRLLTSGARKADGHVHVAITDEAVSAEMTRLEQLAQAFFKLASKARGLSVEEVQGYQANVFLGKDAVRKSLADSVMSFDDVLLALGDSETAPEGAATAGGNETDRRATGSTNSVSINPRKAVEANMTKLDALIKKTEAALATERDPAKLVALASSLEAYKKTKKHVEHVETEEDDKPEHDEPDGDEPEDDDEDEDEKKAAAAKRAEEEAAKPPMDDDEEEEEESEEKSAKKALALVQSLTGMTGKKALGALRAIAMTAQSTAADVAKLKRAQVISSKASIIKDAVGKYITPSEATFLRSESLSTVKGFVEMRQKTGVIVHTDETTLIRPSARNQDGSGIGLSEDMQKHVDDMVAAFSGSDKEGYRKSLTENLIKATNSGKNVALALSNSGRV